MEGWGWARPVTTCRPASRHIGAPSEPKGSDQIRSRNGCDEKQQVQSDASCAQRHNEGSDICTVTLETILKEPAKGGLETSKSFSHTEINKDLFKGAVVHKIDFFEL